MNYGIKTFGILIGFLLFVVMISSTHQKESNVIEHIKIVHNGTDVGDININEKGELIIKMIKVNE